MPVDEVRRFERDLLDWFHTRHGGLLAEIRTTGALPDEAVIRSAIENFRTEFLATVDQNGAGTAPSVPDAAGDAEPEPTPVSP